MINVQVVQNNINQILSSKNIAIATTRAINVGIRKSKTQFRKDITSEYKLKYADTKNMPISVLSTYRTLEGRIEGSIKPISLAKFNPQQITHTITGTSYVYDIQTRKRKRKKVKTTHRLAGLEFEIKRGQKKRIPFAFMINSNKGGIRQQVWARGEYQGNRFEKSKNRLPITPLKTASPYGTMINENVQSSIKPSVIDSVKREYQRQINLLTTT